MKERGILFSGPMVRAILDGTKTQSRRVMRPQPGLPVSRFRLVSLVPDGKPGYPEWQAEDIHSQLVNAFPHGTDSVKSEIGCPYGVPGDRLWVRETWQYADWTEEGQPYVRYASDGAVLFHEYAGKGEELVDVWADLSDPRNVAVDGKAADRRWRPSIHMPRWASRITLEVTEVRVQRLQEISEEDALAEGSCSRHIGSPHPPWYGGSLAPNSYVASARMCFAGAWNSINAARAGRGRGWESNPWVWAITFQPIASGGAA